jgi:hypothetical protein
MNFKSIIRDLSRTFEMEDEAASDLWSWLPSHYFAKKLYDDYADEKRPSNSEVMREAAVLFSLIRHQDALLLSRSLGLPQDLLQGVEELVSMVREHFDWEELEGRQQNWRKTPEFGPPSVEEMCAVLVELHLLPKLSSADEETSS